jgi:hypothetical protein
MEGEGIDPAVRGLGEIREHSVGWRTAAATFGCEELHDCNRRGPSPCRLVGPGLRNRSWSGMASEEAEHAKGHDTEVHGRSTSVTPARFPVSAGRLQTLSASGDQ